MRDRARRQVLRTSGLLNPVKALEEGDREALRRLFPPGFPRHLLVRAAAWLVDVGTTVQQELGVLTSPIPRAWLVVGIASAAAGLRHEAHLACLRCARPRPEPGWDVTRGRLGGWTVGPMATPPKLRGQVFGAFLCPPCGQAVAPGVGSAVPTQEVVVTQPEAKSLTLAELTTAVPEAAQAFRRELPAEAADPRTGPDGRAARWRFEVRAGDVLATDGSARYRFDLARPSSGWHGHAP